jgi:protein gp37
MSDNTGIEWTDRTWNPTTGCDRVSPGCDHCYAMTMAKRLKGMGSAKYQTDGDPKTSGPGFGIAMHPETLSEPLRWRKPQRIFVNSMSDLFHDEVSDDFIANVWAVMARANHHTFQVLTKRHARMRSLLSSDVFHRRVYDYLVSIDYAWISSTPVVWPLRNVWLGVSAENQQWADIRIPALLETPAAIRFVSAEPLLGPIDLWHSHCPTHDFAGGMCTFSCPERRRLDWVIVGGESGWGARPMHPDWPRQIRDDCERRQIAFLFKQWGEWTPERGMRHSEFFQFDNDPDSYVMRVGKKAAGRKLDGQLWGQYPEEVTA